MFQIKRHLTDSTIRNTGETGEIYMYTVPKYFPNFFVIVAHVKFSVTIDQKVTDSFAAELNMQK